MAKKTKEIYKTLKKKYPGIQVRGITRCPDALITYKGQIIMKFSHTKESNPRYNRMITKRMEKRIQEIDAMEATK